MFLLVFVRHVGAHPDEYQHGVSIQIFINLGKTFLRISRIRNIPLTCDLERVFAYLPPFISQILDFISTTVLIFILISILNGVTLKTSNCLFRLVSMPLVILYHGDAPPYNLGNDICNHFSGQVRNDLSILQFKSHAIN